MRHTAFIAALLLFFACKSDNATISIQASSTLPGPGGRYAAKNLTDQSQNSWCEGSADSGIGQSLTVKTESGSVSELVVFNGFGIQEHYARNNRVMGLKIAVGAKESTVTLKDSPAPQTIALPEKLKAGQKAVLTIASVYRGASDNDTCIAEIALSSAALQSQPPAAPVNFKEVTFGKRGDKSITLHANHSVTGSFCTTCQVSSPIVEGTWSVTPQGISVKFTVNKATGNGCGDLIEGAVCERTLERHDYLLTDLTASGATTQGGEQFEILDWKD